LLSVAERFYSIQGESTRAGLPCLFIRLAGCNLRCSFCDSSYTWEEPGRQTPVREIVAWSDGYPGVMLELTGGEPLLQEEIYPLMETLLQRGRTVLVETNGCLPIHRVPEAAAVILDIKCPGSGMDSKNDWTNMDTLSARAASGSRDEVKFVLSSEEDFHWARGIVEQYGLHKTVPVLFSPVAASLAPQELATLILTHHLPVRLQLQLHKILWPELDRGV
jgi:7-carboxy-7-deazaguanine synthase